MLRISIRIFIFNKLPNSSARTNPNSNYLDYKTGLIDTIIAQKEDLIQKLKEQRQAIINEAVTKGLNKDVKLKDSGIEWLGEIPEHWEVVKLRYLSDITTGDKDTENREDDAKYPFYCAFSNYRENFYHIVLR